MQGHVVQLFDTSASVAERVVAFVRDGLLEGDVVLLVITPQHWQDISARCRETGIDVEASIGAGWLTVRDASEALARLTHRGQPDWSLFERTVGAQVRHLCANGTRLRVYGEMVDLLAREGEFAAAERLEGFWNRLAAREVFTLLCGYSAEHFGNPRDGESLHRICQMHSHAQTDPGDVLGTFLLRTHAAG